MDLNRTWDGAGVVGQTLPHAKLAEADSVHRPDYIVDFYHV
jgi:hypothetical protein